MIGIEELLVGDILASTVLSVTGKVLLGKNVELTSRHISLLTTWDVQNVFIHVEDELADEPVLHEAESEKSEEYVNFIKEYDSIVTNTAEFFDVIKKREIIPVNHLKDTAGRIYSSIVNNNFEVMNYLLISDHTLAELIPRHSVMVAYFSGIIARQMKWREADIAGVSFASLLHDIGSLTKDKGNSTSQQANIGETARLLKGTKGLSSEVILGIVQHRERANNSDFSMGGSGSNIHPYAKVIAVADAFHNLTYVKGGANPFPVLDLLTREMYGQFDPDVCQNLICRVKDSLEFTKVLLSNGQEAEVIFFQKSGYSLPIVRTMDNQVIDLSKSNGLTINRVVIPA